MTFCIKCKRELKNDKSIARGAGKTCAHKLGLIDEPTPRIRSGKIKTKNKISGFFS